MDKNRLDIRAAEVAESLKGFLRDLVGTVVETQAEHTNRLTESMRALGEALDARESQRESRVASDVSAKLTALRDDVRRLLQERDGATEQSVAAVVSQIQATFRAEMVTARHEIAEEVATANRSTFDVLMAEIKGVRR